MKLYEEYVLPHLIHCCCGLGLVDRKRQQLVPRASGRVLEVGMGSGLNLRHYNPDKVSHVWGVEPSAGMARKAQANIRQSPVPVEWLSVPGEAIPLDDHSADTVVLTYTLCTIPGHEQALREMRRILKPGGQLLFSEHGLAAEPGVQAWQHRLNPIWKTFAGGCHLNRPIAQTIRDAGFQIDELTEGYLNSGPKLATYHYQGVAR